ncbi:ETC complex I subunit [Magnetospirillum molischianum]|uniref:NADH-ubiquinone oxidoreductase family protein n=1 Tax=Magnetospirillum molischianum DSM 120 TaxID=1150626 RepID=H8FRE2_MAGML|nr:ETC complex I subunit [Magnetospirillum molischianum]CCG40930.1 NADH-ubiquinone oxidoreductase family protein [Magnetospirillum molischianum DSM 120]
MQVRIYRPSKSAMQSGPGGSARNWVLEAEPTEAKLPDALMGWSGSGDTATQIRLTFASRDEAVAFARRKGLDYRVDNELPRRQKPKSYADNFRSDKREFGRF